MGTHSWLNKVVAGLMLALLDVGLTVSPAAAIDAPPTDVVAHAPIMPIGLPMTISTCDANGAGWETGESWAVDTDM